VALVTAVLTAFYMTRAVLLTFFGDYRGEAHPHESPVAITGPLIVLASGSVVVGFLNATAFDIHLFTDWVHLGPVAESEPFNYGFAGVSILGALAGIAAGYGLYSRWREREPLRALGPGYALLEQKYYLDTIYMRGIIRPIQYPIARAVDWTNQKILDGVVNTAARVAVRLGGVVDIFDRKVVDGAVNDIAFVTGRSSGLLRYIQSGNVQRYAVLLFAGTALLAIAITRNFPALFIALGVLALGVAWVIFRPRRGEEPT
jgi:NADH-quinone oxidoreductase subunit L